MRAPYCETTDAILIYNGKIVAADKGRYLEFPGGGIERRETE